MSIDVNTREVINVTPLQVEAHNRYTGGSLTLLYTIGNYASTNNQMHLSTAITPISNRPVLLLLLHLSVQAKSRYKCLQAVGTWAGEVVDGMRNIP